MNSSLHAQLVKWTVPAVALVVAFFWYKRRRIDRDELQWNDSGGTAKSDRVEKAISNDAQEVDTSIYDSDVKKEINQESSNGCCYTRKEEMTRVPRKVSESMDIPLKKSISQSDFCSSSQIRYEDVETIRSIDVELDSNSNGSYFEMIATSTSSKFSENVDNVTTTFQDVSEEQTVHCEPEPSGQNYTEECNYKEDGQQSKGHTIDTQGQEVDDRDSANHSPVSVVLDGSVTDEAGSEGSNTDSGKGEYQ